MRVTGSKYIAVVGSRVDGRSGLATNNSTVLKSLVVTSLVRLSDTVRFKPTTEFTRFLEDPEIISITKAITELRRVGKIWIWPTVYIQTSRRQHIVKTDAEGYKLMKVFEAYLEVYKSAVPKTMLTRPLKKEVNIR